MADHLSEQLLDALVPALTGLTTTGARVFRNRPDDRELQANEVPGLLVYQGGEEVEVVSLETPAVMRRDQGIRVGIRVAATSNVDQTVNQVRKEVEVALAPGVSVAGRTLVPVYAGMLEPDRDGEGEREVAAAELAFVFTWFARADAPDAYA